MQASGGISNTNITSVTAPSAANSRPELSHLMDFLFKNRKPEIKSFLAEFENLLSQLPNVKRKFDVYSWDGQVYRARPNNGFSLLILRTGRDVLNVMTEIEDMLEQERAMLESTKESTRSETRNSAVVPSQPPTLGDFISTQEEYYDNNSRKGPWLSLAATLVMACKQRELIIAKDVVARFPSLENVSFTFMPPSTGGRTREMRWMAGSVYDSTYDVEWLVVSLDGTLTEELLRQPEKCTQFRDDCPIELLFSVFCRSPSVRIMIVGESVWGWLAHFVLAECVKRWQSRQQRNTLPTYLYSVAFSPVHLNGVLQIDEGLREYCRNAQVAKRMYSVFHRTDTFGPILRIAQEAETIRLNSKKAGLSPLSELLRGFETSKGDLDAMEKTFKRVKTLLENELRMKSRNWLKDDLLGNCIVELRDLVVTPVSFDGVNLLGDRNPPTQNLRSAQYLVETNDTHSNLSADRTSVSEQQKLELDFRFCPQPFISNVFLYVPYCV
ncbi:hypothetical protein DFJ73DRAFT_862680 [Zopfochytrium polystomum]|nr:hypothetical protein DFJ73DRAFT_862680 [Zopfochytrium polystomum]